MYCTDRRDTGRYLITMVGSIFDPGRSPGMKWYQGGEERKGKKGGKEGKKRRKESQSIKETNSTAFPLTSPNKIRVSNHSHRYTISGAVDGRFASSKVH